MKCLYFGLRTVIAPRPAARGSNVRRGKDCGAVVGEPLKL